MAHGNSPVALREVREGDLISYPGPPRRHSVAKALGLPSSHVGIYALVDGCPSVIEVGLSGVRARPMVEVLETFEDIEVLVLPVDDRGAESIVDEARTRLDTRMWYSMGLGRLTYLWANVRAVDHYAVRPLARLAFPVVALAAIALGAWRTTCTGFVCQVLESTGHWDSLGLRFDRPVGSSPSPRPHRGMSAFLCGPSDYAASPVVRRVPVQRDGSVVSVAA
ncbi:MAG: hypothetical protein AAF567_00975 [Actinomycetota bacterium]